MGSDSFFRCSCFSRDFTVSAPCIWAGAVGVGFWTTLAGVLVWTGRTGANTAGGLEVETEVGVKLLELEAIVLGAEDMNENEGWEAGVPPSSDENLSLRLSLTAGGVATL